MRSGYAQPDFTTRDGDTIIFHITKLMEKALEIVRLLPRESQDEIAHAMLSLAGSEAEPEGIEPSHLPDVLESLAEAKRRQFASDAEEPRRHSAASTREAALHAASN